MTGGCHWLISYLFDVVASTAGVSGRALPPPTRGRQASALSANRQVRQGHSLPPRWALIPRLR